MNRRAWSGVALMLLAVQAFAGEVAVTAATVRATAPGQDSASVALHIRARSDARLVAVASPAAQHVEIHIMKHENGMMEMRAVDALALPANVDVALGAGSHLMLVGLKRPLKPGDSVSLELTVEFADKHREVVKLAVRVQAIGGSGRQMPGMAGHGMEGQGGGMEEHMH